MPQSVQMQFHRPVGELVKDDRVHTSLYTDPAIFDAEMERIVERAGGVIAMGGYNTFCEILSFDKPAVIVPREKPRREQWIRAARAQELGLARMLEDPAEQGGTRDIAVMAETIRKVMSQPRPSAALKPGMMDGLDEVVRLSALWLDQ